MAICGSNTTAALECYLNNIKLVVLKESDTPIMTPVYELPELNLFQLVAL